MLKTLLKNTLWTVLLFTSLNGTGVSTASEIPETINVRLGKKTILGQRGSREKVRVLAQASAEIAPADGEAAFEGEALPEEGFVYEEVRPDEYEIIAWSNYGNAEAIRSLARAKILRLAQARFEETALEKPTGYAIAGQREAQYGFRPAPKKAAGPQAPSVEPVTSPAPAESMAPMVGALELPGSDSFTRSRGFDGLLLLLLALLVAAMVATKVSQDRRNC